MKYRIIFFMILFTISFYGKNRKKFILIENFSHLHSCRHNLLIEEGDSFNLECLNKLGEFRKFSFCPQIIPPPPGTDKGKKYISILLLKVRSNIFTKFFNLFGKIIKYQPDFMCSNKTYCDFLDRKSFLDTYPLPMIIVTVSDGKRVTHLFFYEKRMAFLWDEFDNILGEVPEKIRNRYGKNLIGNYGDLLRIEDFLGYNPIKGFAIQKDIGKYKYFFLKENDYFPQNIFSKIKGSYFSVPDSYLFFWNPIIAYKKGKVKVLSYKFKVNKILQKIRNKFFKNKAYISYHAFFVKRKRMKLKKSEILISIILNSGVEYYKLKKSDPDVKKLLKIIYEKMKEEKGK